MLKMGFKSVGESQMYVKYVRISQSSVYANSKGSWDIGICVII